MQGITDNITKSKPIVNKSCTQLYTWLLLTKQNEATRADKKTECHSSKLFILMMKALHV